MANWFAKDFPVGEWAHVQDAFENISVRFGAPHNMMLISERSADGVGERLYVCLPHPDMIKVFEGFEPVSESELPNKALLLVGDQTAFTWKFSFASH